MDEVKRLKRKLSREAAKCAQLEELCETKTREAFEAHRQLEGSLQQVVEESKLKEKALNQLSKLASLGEMAGNLGHEINNPLAIIFGLVNKLRRTTNQLSSDDQPKFEKNCARIEDAANRVHKISKSLSALIRETNDDDLEELSVDIIVEDVVDLASEKIKSKGIDLTLNGLGQELQVKANRIQLGQVTVNIVNNAIHAIEGSPKPKISFTVIAEENKVTIQIANNGPLIPPDIQKNIFIPFFTTKEVGKGTGLGLPISKKVMTSHGGDLYLLENAEETTFCIELPLLEKSEKKAA